MKAGSGSKQSVLKSPQGCGGQLLWFTQGQASHLFIGGRFVDARRSVIALNGRTDAV
jgi:hypothetical protein